MSINNAEQVVGQQRDIEKLMLQGHAALKQGKSNEAHMYFSNVLAIDPNNKEVLPFRATASIAMGMKSEAEKDLDNQDSPTATVNKLLSQANELMNKRDYDVAEQTILKAKVYDGTSRQKTDAALMLGVLYAVTERYEDAKEQYTLAQTSMPDDDRYVANIIGLNALIRVRELTSSKGEDIEHMKVGVARDFIEAHDDIIPSYNPGNSLMARIAISITAGDFDAAEKKLWTSISTNMGYANHNVHPNALSNSTCLSTTASSMVGNKDIHSEINNTGFIEKALEKVKILEQKGLSASAA